MTDIFHLVLECVPVGRGRFDPFIMEVPMLDVRPLDRNKAARRGYMTAFAMLRRVEPQDFMVREYSEDPDNPGAVIDKEGFVDGPDTL